MLSLMRLKLLQKGLRSCSLEFKFHSQLMLCIYDNKNVFNYRVIIDIKLIAIISTRANVIFNKYMKELN